MVLFRPDSSQPPPTHRARGPRSLPVFALLLASLLALPSPASAASLDDARKLFNSGKYLECIEACADAIQDSRLDGNWWVLKVRAEMATGQYKEALATYESALSLHDRNIPLLLLGRDVLRMNDRADEGQENLVLIRVLASRAPWRYTDPPSRVALGRALLAGGADARQVLELFYDQAKKDNPAAPEPHVAAGDLAVEKFDYAVAAESYSQALKLLPDDPDVHYGLARAYQESDSERASAALTKALELNPRHPDSLLLRADNLIDREDYEEAGKLLEQVIEVNPVHSRAWAYRAVVAHLKGNEAHEQAYRGQALSTWTTNPEVDHLIGQKLSQNYRFAEGAQYQRQALVLDPSYRPARAQLCQDLLRLGKEDEGWALAAEVFKEDQYNVLAYNLVTLHDTLSKYRTLENDHFIVRMEGREADIYGQRVLSLLERARQKLCPKYGVELPDGKVTVEIFPQQKDFAIRTFGLPGGAGFLGVCFGSVVTVNSPASRTASPSNWEAVVWHEFCHVVTLQKTKNKMPRWLSEGISVFEERGESPAWGQVMTPQYRELILSGGATPVSKLSSAFLRPPTPMHLQFAYYESSMVVQHVTERFGAEALNKVLADLGEGLAINESLAKHTEPIEQLDANFEKWLKAQAEGLAPAVKSWDKPELLDAESAAMAKWNQEHPDNFWGLLGEGRALVAEQKYKEARPPLERAIQLYPGYGEAGGPYALLAAAHRELGEVEAERAALEKHIALNAEAIEPRLRLIELAAAAKDWKAVKEGAEGVLAVNPLVPAPYRHLAAAAEALGERSLAIGAHRTLLVLDPLDRAEHHYQLGRLLFEDGQRDAARREVVKALEEAPRYRDAHRLLLKVAGEPKQADVQAPGQAPPPQEPTLAPDAPTDAGPELSPDPVKNAEAQ